MMKRDPEGMMETKNGAVRKVAALIALGAFFMYAFHIIWMELVAGCGFNESCIQQIALLIGFLATAFYGVAMDRVWGRWAGLAVGLLSLWRVSSLFLSDLFYGWSPMIMLEWQNILLAGGGLLLMTSLLGPTMYMKYEGSVYGELPSGRWDRFRLLVVRWSAVVAITLLPFIVASTIIHEPVCGLLPVWLNRVALGVLGVAVFFGIVLIARQKTAGVLLIAISGSIAAWLFGTIFSYDGSVNWFEATCRAGHSLIYLLPVLILSAPMVRLISRRGR